MEKGKSEKLTLPFDDAIAITGYGKFNLYVLLAAGLCLMCVIIETMGMMFIIPAAQCDLDLSLSEKGVLSSISFFGVLTSSYLWGYIADTRGRRNVLILSLLLSSSVSFICSIIPWDWLFILLRYINGIFVGGAATVVYAYIGEFHDNIYRPKVVSWLATFVAFGNMFLPGLAWLILPQHWSYTVPGLDLPFRPWRLLIILYALPSLLAATLMHWLPESPKYLLTQAKYDQVLDILKQMYSQNSGKPQSAYPVGEIVWNELGDNIVQKRYNLFKAMWKQTAPLFRGSFLLKTIIVSSLQFGMFSTNAGITMWYPGIVNKMSHFVHDNPNKSVSLCPAVLYDEDNLYINPNPIKTCRDSIKPDVFLVALIMAGAYALVYVFVGSVINIIGKTNLLVGFISVTTICGIATQFVTGYTLIQFLIGSFLMGGASIGIINAIVVDLYPTQIRAVAFAVSLMFGRFGAMAGSNVVGPLIYNFCDYLFYAVAALHLLMILLAFLLPSSGKMPKLI